VAAADASRTAASKVEQAESLGEDPLAFVEGEQQGKAQVCGLGLWQPA